MGKATIQSNLEKGKYSILYHRNVTKIEARIAKMQTEVQPLNTVDLPVYTAAWEQIEATVGSLATSLDAAIASGVEEDMQRASSYLQTARIQAESAKSALNNLKLKILSLEKEIEFLQANKPIDEVMQAWCADLNENLTGIVGTIEIPGEVAAPIIIYPGGEDGTEAVYDAAVDGIVTPSLGISPEESFYNLALLPCWQKWQPTYRVGTITALDANTCDVNLDAAESSQQGLDVNKQDIWGDVPISYMSCNGGAFKVGDRVIVEFSPVGDKRLLNYTPLVIGFESNPKGCVLKFRIFRGNGTGEITTYMRFRIYRSTGQQVPTNEYSTAYVTQIINGLPVGYWNLIFLAGHTADTAGYWVEYNNIPVGQPFEAHYYAGVVTQYPYIYKTFEKFQVENLIAIRSEIYEDTLHYWSASYTPVSLAHPWEYHSVAICNYETGPDPEYVNIGNQNEIYTHQYFTGHINALLTVATTIDYSVGYDYHVFRGEDLQVETDSGILGSGAGNGVHLTDGKTVINGGIFAINSHYIKAVSLSDYVTGGCWGGWPIHELYTYHYNRVLMYRAHYGETEYPYGEPMKLTWAQIYD